MFPVSLHRAQLLDERNAKQKTRLLAAGWGSPRLCNYPLHSIQRQTRNMIVADDRVIANRLQWPICSIPAFARSEENLKALIWPRLEPGYLQHTAL